MQAELDCLAADVARLIGRRRWADLNAVMRAYGAALRVHPVFVLHSTALRLVAELACVTEDPQALAACGAEGRSLKESLDRVRAGTGESLEEAIMRLRLMTEHPAALRAFHALGSGSSPREMQ